ncbi:MAG: helix-turn-helix domain-containing protein [Nitrospinota bacterium]
MYGIRSSKSIGKKIKDRRQEIGMTQEQLAEKMGVTYQQVQRYENGVNKLNVEQLQVIADSLDVPISFFFEDTQPIRIRDAKSQYVSVEEEKFLKYFRKVGKKEYKKSILLFMELASKAEKK